MTLARSFDLLEINRALFKKMEELAIQQEKSVEDDRIKGFLQLQSRRERLRNEINKNMDKYRNIGKNDPDNLKNAKIDILSQEIVRLIRSIQDIDKRIEGQISEKKNNLFNEITEYRQGKKALKGYSGHSSKKAKYISRMG